MILKLASIFFTMILVDNYVLSKFLGICPFLGVSKKLDSAVGMSLAVTFVMVMATAVTWPIQMFILTPASGAWDMGYLQTIVFILVIAYPVRTVCCRSPAARVLTAAMSGCPALSDSLRDRNSKEINCILSDRCSPSDLSSPV